MAAPFLDTNVLIYALTDDPKAERAEALLAERGTVSVQILNEFASVARRKLGRTWREVSDALAAIRTVCGPVLPIDMDTHADALRLAERHGFSIFDALVVASALRAGCGILYSEDMHDGQLIDGRLRIVDPFAAG